jgi:cobalt-zinc-cadmium efflux system membrane fusion protein
MTQRLTRWFLALASAVPPMLVCLLLAAVAYWGHSTGWQAKKFGVLIGAAEEESDADDIVPKADGPTADSAAGPPDWCDKHQTPDSLCTTCHPDLAATPAVNLPPTDDQSVRTSHDPRTCRTHLERIRFPSTEVLNSAGVGTAAVREQSLTETVLAYGTVDYDPNCTVKLGPRAGGAVWKVFKRLGDPVRAGEVLALIDAAEVGKAKSEYLQAAVHLDTRTRFRQALHPGTASERNIEEAEGAVREARARLYTAQQALLNLGLPLRGDEAALPDDQLARRLQFLGLPADVVSALPTSTTTANLLPLVAPRDGVVIDRKAETGEIVTIHQAMFTVSDVRQVHAHLDFRPDDAPRLALGQRVEFRIDGDPLPVVGTLEWIGTSVDEKSRLVHAHAEFDNPDGRLRANSFGTAAVSIRVHDRAAVVPADAVQWEGCCHVVFVRESELVFRPRKVRLGLRQDGVAEVLVGVRPGDVVAAAGSHVLKSYLLRDRLGAAED